MTAVNREIRSKEFDKMEKLIVDAVPRSEVSMIIRVKVLRGVASERVESKDCRGVSFTSSQLFLMSG